MSSKQFAILSADCQNLALKLLDCFKRDFDNEKMLPDKCLFSRPNVHLGTVVCSGVV